jgi:Holliday junction resolvase RusA-like endonuclease
MVVKKPKTTKFTHPKWDIDNGVKACLDCLNNKLWLDDSQIVSLHVTKEWAEPGEDGYFIICIHETP